MFGVVGPKVKQVGMVSLAWVCDLYGCWQVKSGCNGITIALNYVLIHKEQVINIRLNSIVFTSVVECRGS